MADLDTTLIDLLPVTRDEAARIAVGVSGPDDFWAVGFPREDDSMPASGVAATAEDPAPFTVYKIIPRVHGLVIGTAGFYGPPDESGEVTIGYGMVKPEWGHGYGTAAVAGLVAVCRAHGVTAVNADTEYGNVGSQRVLLKNGFERVRSSDKLRFYTLVLK
jgi:RimJ/RimL family protein N-acetyltransferase